MLMAASCRYCCKSPKLPAANFSAVKKSDRQPPVDVSSITLPRSPASLSLGDEVPHIFTRKSRVQNFDLTSAKRLLQQNRHIAASNLYGGMSAAGGSRRATARVFVLEPCLSNPSSSGTWRLYPIFLGSQPPITLSVRGTRRFARP